jgi:hypothetical protein
MGQFESLCPLHQFSVCGGWKRCPILPLKVRVVYTSSQVFESCDEWILPLTFKPEDRALMGQGAALIVRPEIYFEDGLR